METGSVDVAVVGGGPGGCAAALMLRRHAPGLTVALLEASRYQGPRIGETLPPPASAVLEHLGVWDAFQAQHHHPAYGTAAAWGGEVPHEHDFLFGIRDVGWHLDRGRFDAMLAAEASARGADLRLGARVVDARRDGDGDGDERRDGDADGWRLRLASGDELRARLVVDATGAVATFARRFGGARSMAMDRLAGFVRFSR
ncbi:MAG TPA: FAD-dependent monooxygenase, partial [Longimicrobiaceae bacterium]